MLYGSGLLQLPFTAYPCLGALLLLLIVRVVVGLVAHPSRLLGL